MQIIKSRSWAIFSQFTAKFINFTAIFAKIKTQLFVIGFVWYLPHRRSEAFLRACRLPFFIFLRWVFIVRVGNIAFTKPRNCAYFVLDIAQLCLKYTKLEKKENYNLLSNHFTTLMQNYVQI